MILIFLCIFKHFLCIFKIKRGDLNTMLFTKVFMFLDSGDKNIWENEQFEIIWRNTWFLGWPNGMGPETVLCLIIRNLPPMWCSPDTTARLYSTTTPDYDYSRIYDYLDYSPTHSHYSADEPRIARTPRYGYYHYVDSDGQDYPEDYSSTKMRGLYR